MCPGLELTVPEPERRFRGLQPDSGDALLLAASASRVRSGAPRIRCRRERNWNGVSSWLFLIFFSPPNFRTRGSQDRSGCDFHSICCRAVQQDFLLFSVRVSSELKFGGRSLATLQTASANLAVRGWLMCINGTGSWRSHHCSHASDDTGSSLMSHVSLFPLWFRFICVLLHIYLVCFLE